MRRAPAGSTASSAGANQDAHFVVLESDADGVDQISEVLQGYTGLSAVHVVSHGSTGGLRLGSARLDASALDEYADRLATWGDALVADGDLLLYGCRAAEGEDGAGFVARLADLTGADVAASDDATGGGELGGDWSLEHYTGPIEALSLSELADLSGYGGLLADIEGTDGADVLVSNAGEDDTLSGGLGDDTYQFQDGWGHDTVKENEGEGDDTLDFSGVTADLTFTSESEGAVSVTGGTNEVENARHVENLIGDTDEIHADTGSYYVIDSTKLAQITAEQSDTFSGVAASVG